MAEVVKTYIGATQTWPMPGTPGPPGPPGPSGSSMLTINPQTATSYTLTLADAGRLVSLANAAAVTVTVPAAASVAFPVGTVIELARLGAGTVGVVAAGGGVVRAADSKYALRAQYSPARLVKIAADEWLLTGDLT
jgi:hypothetical protein